MKNLLLPLLAIFLCVNSFAQDPLENIFVEIIPVSQQAADADDNLTTNHSTYRIFVDMKEGYEFQLMQGIANHPLIFKTSTSFYNEENDGDLTPLAIRELPTMEEPLYYDSWITIGAFGERGAATSVVPLAEDTDGTADGFFGDYPAKEFSFAPGTDNRMEVMFGYDNVSDSYEDENASVYIGGGVVGPTVSNSVCIGQFTTDGIFEFQINVQLRLITDDRDKDVYVYYANDNSPAQDETDHYFNKLNVLFLNYPIATAKGCMDKTACNYDANAEEDDGSCEYAGDCQKCTQEAPFYALIDENNNGICDAKEVLGCTSKTACNFNPDANVDNGSCIEPEFGMTECKEGKLVMSDADNDGIPDKEDPIGCKNNKSCNYNPFAKEEDGNCTDPAEEDCYECKNGELVIVDYDNDGICNKVDDSGCKDPEACNYNPYAELDDGCTYEDTCYKCLEHMLVLVLDADNDGICDVTIPDAIESLDLSLESTIYPNPAIKSISLKIKDTSIKNDFTVKIINATGHVVFIKRYTASQGIIGNIDIAHLPSGVYTITISNDKGIEIHKSINKL